jgi:hypothetical protein
MKKAKLIIKWSMLGVPILLIIYGFIAMSFSQIDAFDLGVAIGQSILYWVILCLIILGIIKLIEKRQIKHEGQG